MIGRSSRVMRARCSRNRAAGMTKCRSERRSGRPRPQRLPAVFPLLLQREHRPSTLVEHRAHPKRHRCATASGRPLGCRPGTGHFPIFLAPPRSRFAALHSGTYIEHVVECQGIGRGHSAQSASVGGQIRPKRIPSSEARFPISRLPTPDWPLAERREELRDRVDVRLREVRGVQFFDPTKLGPFNTNLGGTFQNLSSNTDTCSYCKTRYIN